MGYQTLPKAKSNELAAEIEKLRKTAYDMQQQHGSITGPAMYVGYVNRGLELLIEQLKGGGFLTSKDR